MDVLQLEELVKQLGPRVSCDTPEGTSYLLIILDEIDGHASFGSNCDRSPAMVQLLRALADKIEGKRVIPAGGRWLPPDLIRAVAGR